MAYHPADTKKLYGTSADKLLETYRTGLVEKGMMEPEESYRRMIEMRRNSKDYNDLFKKLIGYL